VKITSKYKDVDLRNLQIDFRGV